MTAVSGLAQNFWQLHDRPHRRRRRRSRLQPVGALDDRGLLSGQPARDGARALFARHSRGHPVRLSWPAAGSTSSSAGAWRSSSSGIPGLMLALVLRMTVKEPPRGMAEGRTAAQSSRESCETFSYLWGKRAFRHLALGGGTDRIRRLRCHQLDAIVPGALPWHADGRSRHLARTDPRHSRRHRHRRSAAGWPIASARGISAGTCGSWRSRSCRACRFRSGFTWRRAHRSRCCAWSCRWPSATSTRRPRSRRPGPVHAPHARGGGSGTAVHPEHHRPRAGPQAVGILADLLRPRFDNESLRYALLVCTLVNVWAAAHYVVAGKYLEADLEKV